MTRITERTLRKWRKEALKGTEMFGMSTVERNEVVQTLEGRILRLTQELLDKHLLRKR